MRVWLCLRSDLTAYLRIYIFFLYTLISSLLATVYHMVPIRRAKSEDILSGLLLCRLMINEFDLQLLV